MSRRSVTLLAVVLVGLATLVATPVASASFGFSSAEFEIEGAPGGVGSGASEVQAGSHPFGIRIGFGFDLKAGEGAEELPTGGVKDLDVALPPGLLGGTAGLPQCPGADLLGSNLFEQLCPPGSQVGRITLKTTFGSTTLPVFNMSTPEGSAPQFGVFALATPVLMGVSVRTGADYGLSVELRNLAEYLPVFGGSLELWGVPAAAGHDGVRSECFSEAGCSTEAPPAPFLTMPAACGPAPGVSISADSWEAPGDMVRTEAQARDGEGIPQAITGCGRLAFEPRVEVRSERAAPDSPSGLEVRVDSPQNGDPEGLETAPIHSADVTLPAGFSINPPVAEGLATCATERFGPTSAAPVACPPASRIGSMSIKSPLLTETLEGSIFLAAPHENPFGSMYAVYLSAGVDGIVVKIAGELAADPRTGRLSLHLENLPELPFSQLALSFDGGPRAALATPPSCGSSTLTASFTPYSSEEVVVTEAPVKIAEGCGRRFSPSFRAGDTSSMAGRGTGFNLALSRADGEPDLAGFAVTLPRGQLLRLGSISRCEGAAAASGECQPASVLGPVVVLAGAGSSPLPLTGTAYLTGPYGGAPYGLSIVVPAKVGPFDLGRIVLRAAVSVDAAVAQVTIVSDPLPQIIGGLPLRLRGIELTTSRPSLMLAPSSCAPQQVTAVASAVDGESATLASPFYLGGCGALAFAPRVSARVTGAVSRADGAGLDLAVTMPRGAQANLRSFTTGLPRPLSVRLSTIQSACPRAVFSAGAGACPATSRVGSARARASALGLLLRGGAYLVSEGSGALPRLMLDLSGGGLHLTLAGALRVRGHGASSIAFTGLPDVPLDNLSVDLPRGTHSLLGANVLTGPSGSLCGTRLDLPTSMVAQSGKGLTGATIARLGGCGGGAGRRR